MTFRPYTFALIVPATDRDDGNRFAWALGLQNDPKAVAKQTFSVPLSADGNEPATHYGALSQATESRIVNIFEAGVPPGGIEWTDYGLTEARAAQVLGAITYATGANEAGIAQSVMIDVMKQSDVQRINVSEG